VTALSGIVTHTARWTILVAWGAYNRFTPVTIRTHLLLKFFLSLSGRVRARWPNRSGMGGIAVNVAPRV